MFRVRGILLPGMFLFALTVPSLFVSNAFAQQAKQDVVYLKNGSVIRGVVIEQIPNVSLKIQTRYGSIFVYKMEEVEKITREPPTKVEGRKYPGTALTLAILPGLFSLHGAGQWYNGDIGKGFPFLAAGLIGGIMTISDPSTNSSGEYNETGARPAIGAMIWLSSLVWSSIDAYRSAKRINGERGFALAEQKPKFVLTVDRPNKRSLHIGLKAAIRF